MQTTPAAPFCASPARPRAAGSAQRFGLGVPRAVRHVQSPHDRGPRERVQRFGFRASESVRGRHSLVAWRAGARARHAAATRLAAALAPLSPWRDEDRLRATLAAWADREAWLWGVDGKGEAKWPPDVADAAAYLAWLGRG